MKFEILEIKRKLLGKLHLYPQLVLVKFEDGRTKWFDTYAIDDKSDLFFYILFKNIGKYLKQNSRSRKALFTTTFEITDQSSYQNYEDLLTKELIKE
jgi:hypothetical protein